MAQVQSAALRLILTHLEDTGAADVTLLDTSTGSALPTLSGFEDITIKRLRLGPTADDQAVAFTRAAGLVIVSKDYPFYYRLAADETLVGPTLLAIVLWGDNEAVNDNTAPAQGLTTSVLLTGNGDNEADLVVAIVESTD